MAEITINYKDAAIATMDASGTKTLQTQGKYCEDDIEVVYARPSAPSGTKQISITQNGTTVEDVAAYANAEITVNVSGGGLPSNIEVINFIPTSDVTQSNKLTLTFANSCTNCIVAVVCLDALQAAAGISKALSWLASFGTYRPITNKGSNILRSDGTLGTDQNMCSFDISTLQLSLGGEWGTFVAGARYQAIKIDWGA